MKKMILFLLVSFYCLPVASIDIIQPSYLKGCMEYQGYDRGGGLTLHFRNRCDTGLVARACVTYYNGAQESQKSTSRILRNGRWNITFFDGTSPKAVDWTAAVTPSELPNSCS
jgi:hypothetical protein